MHTSHVCLSATYAPVGVFQTQFSQAWQPLSTANCTGQSSTLVCMLALGLHLYRPPFMLQAEQSRQACCMLRTLAMAMPQLAVYPALPCLSCCLLTRTQ